MVSEETEGAYTLSTCASEFCAVWFCLMLLLCSKGMLQMGNDKGQAEMMVTQRQKIFTFKRGNEGKVVGDSK